MKRRSFLRIAGMGTTVLATGSYFYLNDEKMQLAPEKPGKILLDLHAHVPKTSEEELLELLSQGITALTINGNHMIILSYEDAVQLPGVKEIDKGLFAKLEYKGNTGYFLRAQEIMAEHHVLGIGCNGKKYLSHRRTPERAIEQIRRENGIAVLPHPYLVDDRNDAKPYVYWKLVDSKAERKLEELCESVDEIEAFNAFSINFLPGVIWLKEANELAQQLALKKGFKGVAVSDAHFSTEQVKISGIYIPSDALSFEAIRHYVKTGNFERHEQYISRWSVMTNYLKYKIKNSAAHRTN